MLLVSDIVQVDEPMVLIVQLLKAKLGDDVRFTQLRFRKAEFTTGITYCVHINPQNASRHVSQVVGRES